MNKARRKAIADIQDKLMSIQADIESVRDEEQDAFDNLPESLQYAEKGERMEEFISTLEDATSSVGDAVDYLSEENFY